MKKLFHFFSLIGVVISILLICSDNYFSSLSLYIVGLMYMLIGWMEHKEQTKTYKFYLIVGLFITVVTFLGEFISGYILQSI
ncbi:hypothetical protein OAS93_00725 [Gammaproteobacteria bacterium]|jgi:hypothetical protein|nr:hypothetical protein [Gammaproteobacteria bacterium]